MHPLQLFSDNNEFILKLNFTKNFIFLLFPHHLFSLNLYLFLYLPPVLLPTVAAQIKAEQQDEVWERIKAKRYDNLRHGV